jgi:hypothetical protein
MYSQKAIKIQTYTFRGFEAAALIYAHLTSRGPFCRLINNRKSFDTYVQSEHMLSGVFEFKVP